MRKNLFWMLLTTAFILSITMAGVGIAQAKPVISIDPKDNAVEPDETFIVDITIADISEEKSLHGWEVEITFNSRVVNVVNATEGPFLNATGYKTIPLEPRIDNTEGSIGFGATFMPPFPSTGASGSGILATVTFEAVSGGATDLHFEYTLLTAVLGGVPTPYDEWEYDVEDGHFAYGAAGGVSLELVAGVVIVVAIFSLVAFYYLRRRASA